MFYGIPAAKITVPDEGFPSRGIQSDLGTATDKPRDYHINPGMKKLPRFIQDTDNMLQKIDRNNEKLICRACMWCNRMHRDLSDLGEREYLETRK